jgi:hypothetical protein
VTYTNQPSRHVASNEHAIRLLRPLALLLIVLLATACGQGELVSPHVPDMAPATAGWLSLTFMTPRADDGAVQLTVLGPAMDSLQLAGVAGVASSSGGVAHFVVTGRVAGGVVARFWVPDTRRVSQYVARVNEVATRGTYQLQDLSQGYGAMVTP